MKQLERLMANDAVVYTQVGEDMVLMSPEDGGYHSLNATGAVLWTLLASGPMTLNELAIHLSKTYHIDELVARTDTQAFIEKMLEQNFLKQVS